MQMRFSTCRLLACMAAVVLAGLPGAAAADEWDSCVKLSDDLAVAGCSRAIDSGQYTGRSLARLYARRGGAYQAQGDSNRAVAEYNELMRIDPTYPAAYLNRGNVWFHRGDFDRAFADYNQAIQLDPKYAVAYVNRGSALGSKGDFDRAIANFDQAIQFDPKDAERTTAAAAPGAARATSTGPWRIMTRRSSSIRNMRAPTTTAAALGATRATSTGPSRIITRRSGSIRKSPKPITTAAFAWEMKRNLKAALADFKMYAQLAPSDRAGLTAVKRVSKELSKMTGRR